MITLKGPIIKNPWMKQMKSISDSEVAIEEMKGTITKLSEEIAALEAGIKALALCENHHP